MAEHVALVTALEDLGRELRSAPVRDLAPAVVDRIISAPAAKEVRVIERRRVILLAAAAVLVALAVLSSVRPTREAIADFLGIGDTQIRTVDELELPEDVAVELGRRVDADAAARAAGFEPFVPAALGEPDATYFRTVDGHPQIAQVWAAEPNAATLPALTGAATVLTQTPLADRPVPLYVKEVGRSTPVERVVIDGREAFWIEGMHVRFGLDEPRRAASNTLLWVDDGMIYRLETTHDRAGAEDIARRME
jgi:hypothetical protein